MSHWINLAALGKVLVASLVAGAGLTLLFSVGLVGVSEHAGRVRRGPRAMARVGTSAWLVLAAACFAAVVGGILVGFWAMTQK